MKIKLQLTFVTGIKRGTGSIASCFVSLYSISLYKSATVQVPHILLNKCHAKQQYHAVHDMDDVT